MLRVFVARPDQQSTQGQDKEAIVAQYAASNPMGRAATPDDIANATNRAPAPILHLLREDSIARAAAAVPDAADIYERNIATMERLGPEGWAEMVAKFSEKPHHD